MKTYAAVVSLLFVTLCVYGEDVSNPQTHYLTDYSVGDIVKKVALDINGDGVVDCLFTTTEENPDPTTKISDEQTAGSMSWDVYVSNPGAPTFKVSKSVEIGGEIIQGAGLDVRPDQMYVGNISEISRFGIVTSTVKRSSQDNSTIIYAYTWEGDHFKQWKLAEYLVGLQNASFDKYLKEDKRTHVTVQPIKP